MLYPGHASRAAGNRHYLYINGQWVDPTTLDTSMGAMVGTLNADGTGGSLSYTPEIVSPTMVEGISILYTASNVVVPILSMGFNRALTAGERTSLAGLIAPIAAAAPVRRWSRPRSAIQLVRVECLFYPPLKKMIICSRQQALHIVIAAPACCRRTCWCAPAPSPRPREMQ
jgi:hypothetical protein